MNYEQAVEALYQAPHEAFVSKRQELAAELKGAGDKTNAARLLKLQRPSISAWAVNQLWWHARSAFDALFETAEQVRAGNAPAGGTAAGAIAVSEGFGSAALSAVASIGFSVAVGSVVFAASGTAAVVSSVKSAVVGGGTLAGSGRGIAASMASSAALLREGPACADAEVAVTARKVAATAISTRSYPARFFEQSRIVTPLG